MGAAPAVSAIHAGFRAHADRRPDAAALVWHGETTTYAELAELAAKARAEIEGLGLERGEPLAIVADKSPGTVARVLACLDLGQPFVLPSPTLAESTRDAVLERTRAARLSDVGFLLTTSGSTGLPKVVPLGHGAVDSFTRWAAERFGLGPRTAVLNYAPLNFDLCLLDVWATLRHGGTVVLVDPDRAADGAHLRDLIVDNRVAVVQSVPMFYRLLVDASPAGAEGARGLDHVEHVLVTGDAIPARTLAELPRLFPRARIHNVYGCTETNDSFVHEVGPDDEAPLPLGEPIPGVEALLVGDDGAVVTGPGAGELHVTTPFQTDGYLDAELDQAKFVTRGDPAKRWFRSGDVVRRTADGRLVLEGRNDFQVKVRGVAVNTAEVERVLLDHPQVAEAAVVAIADPVAGKRLHAAVRRAGTERLNSLVLRQHAAGHLVQAAIPSVFRIVDEPLPKTSTGKVDRRSIADAFAGGAAAAAPTPTGE
jgi:acyl-coenzyme A synthetase/AMP-(fatty) acid ligase